MVTWALIPCSKTKAKYPCSAREMYWPSQQFRGAIQVAERSGEVPLILSAMYGIITPSRQIKPYNLTLNEFTPVERERWADRVLAAIRNNDLIIPGDRFVSYLGARYAEFVVPALRERGYEVEEPLKGMGQGKRLAWFKQKLAGREAA